MNDMTIVVNTCDKYEDAWEPFFKLFKTNWPACENYDIILNTENKVFNCDYLKIKTLCGGNDVSWSKRLKNVLLSLNTEFVLLFLEDFFLQEKTNQDMFEEAYNYIKEHKDVGYIGLKYTPERIFKKKNYTPSERFFSRDELATYYRITAMSVIWRREWLIDLLDDNENPWQFEHNATARSKKYSYRVLEINNVNGVCPPVFYFEDKIKFGYGITRGQWLPKNVDLFKRYGIEVNFDNLGINYALYENANNPNPKKVEKQELNLREVLYNIKKCLKKQKKKIVKKSEKFGL